MTESGVEAGADSGAEAGVQGVLQALGTLAGLSLEQATAMPPGMYTNEHLLAREQEQIFSTQWLCAGRSDAVSEAGSYLCYAIGDQPIVIIRQKDGSVRAFANVCQHRLMQLLDGTGQCAQSRIVCPYHAWTYQIDGRLIGAPEMNKRPEFDTSDHSLPSVRCEVWEGWIYVTLSDDVPSVATELADLQTLVAHYHMSDYVQVAQQDHVWDTNWKLLTENFMEGYHLPVAHRATVGAHFPVEDTRFSTSRPHHAFTYQSFTKTEAAPVGNAHPDNTWLAGEQRNTSIMPTVFPSHMYVLAPDHLWYLSLQPLSMDKVSIRYGVALAPEVLSASKEPENLIEETCRFLAAVNEEDRFVVEGIMKGAKAPLSRPGPLCWLERENHEFTQYLARRLCQVKRYSRLDET